MMVILCHLTNKNHGRNYGIATITGEGMFKLDLSSELELKDIFMMSHLLSQYISVIVISFEELHHFLVLYDK